MHESSSDEESGHSSKPTKIKAKMRRKKRKLSSSSVEAMPPARHRRRKTSLTFTNCLLKSGSHSYSLKPKDRFSKEKLFWNKVVTPRFRKRLEDDSWLPRPEEQKPGAPMPEPGLPGSRCWVDELPHEILLKIFGYLPLGMLLHTIPLVCKKWELLALDWTLWKAVEDLTVKNMVISTAKVKNLLRTIPKLKKLELILRNDTQELLHELFETQQNLEVLKLDRCYRSTLQMNILSQTMTSILRTCPKLKTLMLSDTYFHSKNFYVFLAKKFKTMERINVTCTTKMEMDIFMENLKQNVTDVEFQRVPMMGRAEGKQIYWGPILGLVVRPIPTSPFHQQYMHDNYPNYAF